MLQPEAYVTGKQYINGRELWMFFFVIAYPQNYATATQYLMVEFQSMTFSKLYL